MNVEFDGGKSGRMARAAAVASVVGFWALPFSPLVSIGALAMTRGASDWSRRAALTGAALCIAYTVVMALGVARLAWEVWA